MRKHSAKTTLLLAAILLIAAAFRLTDLSSIPPGLQHDEVFHAHDAFTVQQGNLQLWFTSNAGNEPLFIYLMAASTALFGGNALAIRLTAVLAGMLTVALSARWARLAFGHRAGVLTAAFLAVGFWSVWMSRVGLRAVILPPMIALSAWLYLRALHRESPKLLDFALAGASVGLTLYTYPAAFATPIIFAILSIYTITTTRKIAPIRTQLTFWGAAIIAYLPLGIALYTSGGYLRVEQTALPLRALQEGDFQPLIDATTKTLLMWTTKGDPLWRYNIADRPVFAPMLAAVFVMGLLINIWLIYGADHRDSDSAATRVGWLTIPLFLLIGVLPSAVTDSPPAFLRASAALPATYIVLAMGFSTLWNIIERLDKSGRIAWQIPLVMVVVVGFVGIETRRLYFDVWANNEEVQRVYRTDLAEIGAYLEANPAPGGVAISTSEPHHLDRFIFDYTAHGAVEPHWFDGLFALVAPSGDAPGWLFITREPSPGERLQSGYLDDLPLIEERRFPNGSLAFNLYEVPAGGDFLVEFPPPQSPIWWADDPNGSRNPLEYPVQFDDTIRLMGSESAVEAHPGEWLSVTLIFQVTADITTPEPWVIFLHLLDAEGNYVTGRDFLAVPASTWRVGDVFVQLHDLPLPDDLAAGAYHLQMGLYSQADGARFGVMVGGSRVGDRVLFESVEVDD